MIIDNGFVIFMAPQRGYGNEYNSYDGSPMRPSLKWVDGARCQVVPIEVDASVRTAEGIPAPVAKYKLLIAKRHYRPTDIVHLHRDDSREEETEKLSVISAQYLRAVDQYEILCR